MSSINIDDKIIKKAGDKDDVSLTEWQVEEWLKCADDKFYFFENYVWVQAPKGKVLFEPRPYQQRIVKSCQENRHVVALMGRQSGKCICKDTKYTVRSKVTGEIYEITAEEFHTILEREVGRYC